MERDTPQRRAIRDVLAGAGRPMSPEEILVAGRQLVRGLGEDLLTGLKVHTERGLEIKDTKSLQNILKVA